MDAAQLIGNRFQIANLDTDLLGRGGMGQVYRATDLHSGELVAVKVLNPEVVTRAPDVLERFVREGLALRQLNHPNIVRMVAAVEEAGRHYLVMEYVAGGSLADLLQAQGRLPVERVVDIGLDLADALTRAHRLGILHRDLKPANVLLAADGTPRLADFGIARLGGGAPLTQTGVLMGTVDYLSPEACRGEPLDERSDIWSFGVLLFELLTGCVPFGGDAVIARLNAILTQPLPDLAQLVPGLPAAGSRLADLLVRMLDKDRQQRTASVRQVGLELEAIQKGRPVSTPAGGGVAGSRFGPPTPPTEHGPRGHERRLVTILVCEAKGPDGLDPEETLEVMDGAFELLTTPVRHYEGTLAQPMANAIMAFFGAPLAHEDDPERAIRAGQEIIAGVEQYAVKLEKERGIRGFGVRVGINTGQVVVGEVGAVDPRGVGAELRAGYTAVGDAVDLAALMEQNAPAGGILISHATYRHVRGVFDVQAQPPLEVKGKREPVQSYLVERAKPRAWRMGSRGVEGIETRMVGREAELLMVQQAYREAVDGREARVVTVVGEPGVGKSRLLDEFTAWVDLEPEKVWHLRGRATPEGRTVAYSLWRDLFAYRFDILETDTAAEALRKFREGMAGLLEPERADLVGHLVGFDFSASPATAALLGSESFGQIAVAYLVQYLRGLAGQGPVVVLLEDLHWADDSSLDLLVQAVERLPGAALLVVGAARPELAERRPNWGEGKEAYTRLELKPLSKRASRALVQEILQRVPEVPEVVQQLVVEGAEGNPFYAEELVKMLIEDGAIVPGEEKWHVELERLAQVRVPATLTAVLQARLDALPREEKEVLQRASVVGREFWGSLVGELASDAMRAEEVSSLLGALRGRELVYRRERSAFAGTEEYLFKHAVLRDVTYETVLLLLRRKYHTQVAAWLEGHAGERLGEYLSLIAGHYELAGEGEKAAGYFRRSGEELFKVSSYRAALQAFEHALALLPTLPSGEGGVALAASGTGEGREAAELRRRAELLVWLGRVREAIPEYPEAWQHFEAALELARATGDQRIEAQALGGLGRVRYLHHHGYVDAERLLRESLALAQETGDEAMQALNARFLGGMASTLGRYDEARNWAEASHALSEKTGDRRAAADALRVLGGVASGQGEWDKARSYYVDALALAEEVGDRSSAARTLMWLGGLVGLHKAFAEARAYFERSRAIAEEIGDRAQVAGDLDEMALLACEEGAYEEAEAYYKQAMRLYREIGEPFSLAVSQADWAFVLVRQGRQDAAWALLVQALREFMASESSVLMVPVVVQTVGAMGAHLGRFQRGAELLGLGFRVDPSRSWAELAEKRELDMLRAAMGAEALEAALAHGAELDLDQVLAEILACDTPEAYWGTGAEAAPAQGDAPRR